MSSKIPFASGFASRSQPPVVFPVVGSRYVVREWDDTKNKVLVTATSTEDTSVTFQYEDGLTHTTSCDYFARELHAAGIR